MTMKGFLVSFVAGAVTVWLFKDAIAAWVDSRTGAARAQLGRTLHAAADAIEGGLAEVSAGDAPTRIGRVS
jgi:hypothetical protein